MKSNRILGLFIIPVFLCCCITCAKSKTDNKTDTVKEIQYELSNDIFPNPERGFIHNLEIHSEGTPLNPVMLAALKNESVSMVLRLYYLENFKDQPINNAELSLIKSDMQKLRDAGVKCVLRFAYTDDMGGTEDPGVGNREAEDGHPPARSRAPTGAPLEPPAGRQQEERQ